MPKRVEGVLVDVDPTNVEGRTWLRLWVRHDGRTLAYLDPRFEPYFYALPDTGTPAQELARALGRLRVGNMRVQRAEVVTRWWHRARREVVRLALRHPGHTPPLREAARSVAGVADVLEADVPYVHRYLIDKDLRPAGCIRLRVDEGASAPDPVVVDVTSRPERPTEGLSVLAFDIEVYNPAIVPNPERDPVVLVSACAGDGREWTLAAEGHDDHALLESFVRLVRDVDPDVIVTYNGDQFDWPYLVRRAGGHGIRLAVGRDGSPPDLKAAGPTRVTEVRGRIAVDLYRTAQRDLKERVKIFTLDNVGEELGVLQPEDRTHLAREAIARYWDDPGMHDALHAYNLDDARVTLRVASELLPLQEEFARRLRHPVADAARMGRGRQVDAFLMAEAQRRGILAPNKGGGAEETYEGGFVLQPEEGLHENVVALDFSSMYPSLMIHYNVSPETLAPHPSEAPCHVAPEVGHAFLKDPPGFFAEILKGLVRERRSLKEAMRRAEAHERDMLDVRQQTLKILTNAFYGYMGWAQARWYSREAAEATTAWGRHVINAVIALAREQDIRVLYGDTDSLFVSDEGNLEPFVQEVNRRFPLELDVQARYETVFFTGAKKRYAGLTTGGQIVARGLEVRRGDWCALAKRTQEEVLDLVLRERDVPAAARHVREILDRLETRDAPVSDLVIHKTLTQRPEHYKARQAHAAAVERAEDEHPGYKAPVGAKVGYVILEGHEPLHDRAKLVDFLEPDDRLDVAYYADKQVVPAAHRILEHFAYTEGELKGAPKQASLFEFA